MKIILKADVKNLGKKNDIVEVKDGYARNFILPKGLGVEVTDANLTALHIQQEKEKKIAAEKKAKSEEFARKLEEAKILVYNKTLNGKFYGAITSKDLVEAIEKQTGIEIDKKKIILKEPIKDLNEHIVNIKLDGGVVARVVFECKEM